MPTRYFPDEEPDITSITEGYALTDELHGYCSFCGQRGHDHSTCPNRPPSSEVLDGPPI